MNSIEYTEGNCPICLEPLVDPINGPPKTTKCGHIFHQKCIQGALDYAYEPHCPSCRKDVSELMPFIPKRFRLLAATLASGGGALTGGLGTVVLIISACVAHDHAYLYGGGASVTGLFTLISATTCYRFGTQLNALLIPPDAI